MEPDHSQNASPTPQIVIAGGRGLLGHGLSRVLLERGYNVTILSRSPPPQHQLVNGLTCVQWDAQNLDKWSKCLDGATALVNFVGRSVDCPKTPENLRVIHESRVQSCHVLGEAVRSINHPPPVWLQASTAHIVGDPEPKDTVCSESTPPGPQDEMGPSVGAAWEKAFYEAKLESQRGVVLRTTIALGKEATALKRLATVTRWGLGGTVGSGDQWFSWIHQEDFNRLSLAMIEDESYSGAYMMAAPQPVTNRQLMHTFRKIYHRPWSPPAPGIGVRLACRFILNSDGDLILKGRRCVSTRLRKEHDFTFDFPTLEDALKNLRDSAR